MLPLYTYTQQVSPTYLRFKRYPAVSSHPFSILLPTMPIYYLYLSLPALIKPFGVKSQACDDKFRLMW